MSDTPLFSRPVNLSEVGEGGLVRAIEANAAERDALAAAFDIRQLRALTAEVKVSQIGRAGVLVEGRLHADLVQTCVVSLVPVDQTIDETFSLRFSRAGEVAQPLKPGADIHLEAADIDPPEALTGSVLDLGPIVVEHFGLAIDPYPRAPGAELPPEASDSEDRPATSPFAALAGLRRDSGDSG